MKAIEAFARLGPTAIVAALALLAAVLSAVVARRRADMRPILGVFAVVVGANLASFALWSVLTPPRLGDPPLTGWMLVAAHVDHACFVAPRAAVAAAAWRICLDRSGAAAWLVGLATVLLRVATYPAIRGASLATYYLATEVILLVLAYRAVLAWAARQIRTRDTAQLPPVVIGVMVAAESTAVLVGPYRQGFWGAWALAQFAYALAFAVVVLVLAATLVKGGEPWRDTNG